MAPSLDSVLRLLDQRGQVHPGVRLHWLRLLCCDLSPPPRPPPPHRPPPRAALKLIHDLGRLGTCVLQGKFVRRWDGESMPSPPGRSLRVETVFLH